MEFQTNILKGIMTISFFGDLDEKNARATREYIDKNIDNYDFHTLILDMKNVEFMDSTGIGVLLGRYKKLHNKKIEVCVKNLNSQLDKVFRISGLYQIMKAV